MYKSHQVKEGIIPMDAIGGQYHTVFLKPYLHCNRLPFDIIQHFSKPRSWHGAPLASIRRAIPVLGSSRVKTLGRQMIMELDHLRNLYFLDDEEDSTPNKLDDLATQQQTQHSDQGKKRQLDDDTMHDKSRSPKKQRDAQQEKDRNIQDASTTTQCPVWTWGQTFLQRRQFVDMPLSLLDHLVKQQDREKVCVGSVVLS